MTQSAIATRDNGAIAESVIAKRLREVLRYDADTGHFTWAVALGHAHVGNRAGGINWSGYWLIRIDRRPYRAHRLAWLYMTGAWPLDDIDHINGDRADNRWINLRAATRTQNLGNSRRPTTNTSGYKGVTWNAKRGRWQAQINHRHIHHYIGLFDTPEDAHAAYCAAAQETFGEFARTQ